MSLTTTIAAPFKTMRKSELRKSEFIFFLAIDRKWMNKDQAQLLLARAEKDGLIRESGGVLTPTFDLGQVTIPLGYKPPGDLFVHEDPVTDLLERIAKGTGHEVTAVAAEMNALIAEEFDGHLAPEAAAIILARRHDVPFGDLLDALKKKVREP